MYVEKKWIDQHANEYNGDKLATEKAYLQKKYNWIKGEVAKQNQKSQEAYKITKNKSDAVETDIKRGNVNPKQKAYMDALAGGATVQEAIAASNKVLNRDINSGSRTAVTQGQPGGLNLENMKLARLKVDAGVASYLATRDINAAARRYSTINYVYEKDLSKLGLERIKDANRRSQIRLQGAIKAKQDRLNEYNKYHLDRDHFIMDLQGNIKLNPKYDAFTEDTKDGGTSSKQQVDVQELNKNQWEKIEKEHADPMINELMMNIKNLINPANPQMSGEELALFMYEFDQVKDEKGGFKKVVTEKHIANAKEKFNAIYDEWKGNKEKGLRTMRSSHLDMVWFDEWNKWAKKNQGLDVVKRFYTDPGMAKKILNFQSYKLNYDANEAIFEANDRKIQETLENTLNKNQNISAFLSPDVKQEAAQLYNTIVNYGDLTGENAFTQFSDEDAEKNFDLNKEEFIRAFKAKIFPMIEAEGGERGTNTYRNVEEGQDWANSDLQREEWEQVNLALDNNPTMQAAISKSGQSITGAEEERYNFTDRNLINIRDQIIEDAYINRGQAGGASGAFLNTWSGPRGSSTYRENAIEAVAGNIFDQLNNSYYDLTFNPDPEKGLISYVNTISDTDGAATLAGKTQSRYVNMLSPASQSFQDYLGMVKDIRGINFDQSGNYRISTKGNILPEDFEDKNMDERHDMTPAMAQMLIEQSFLSAKNKGQGFGDLKISSNQVAMEDAGTGSMTVYFPRKFLEEQIKTTGKFEGTKPEKLQKYIDDLHTNGITFIAPKEMWTNSMFTGNQLDPTTAVVNALGTIEYTHPNNAGTYTISKVDGVPGSTHMGEFTVYSYEPSQGKVVPHTRIMHNSIDRGGRTISQIQQEMYNTINRVAEINQQLYESYHNSGNQKALGIMQNHFGYTPDNSLWQIK